MKPDDVRFLAELLHRRSGLVIGEDKAYLVESRLTPVAKRLGLTDLDALVQTLRSRPDERMAAAVVEAMTTNETLFFRDSRPFQQLAEVVLPKLVALRSARKKLRIWCAASSTGQEPYSIAMILEESRKCLDGWTVELIATDICDDALERAKAGSYSQFEVQRGLPIMRLAKFFTQESNGWRIKDEIRRSVQFRKHNLIEDNRKLGEFDIIFCRNVLIYFDVATKKRILEQMAKMLPADGYMFLGGTETVLGVTDAFEILPELRGAYAVRGPEGRQRAVA